jgi:hypothetical protein
MALRLVAARTEMFLGKPSIFADLMCAAQKTTLAECQGSCPQTSTGRRSQKGSQEGRKRAPQKGSPKGRTAG